MEFRVAIGALLREFPDLRLAASVTEVPWRSGSLLRNPQELLVRW
jgi:nocardicin N-oxygenase